MRATWLVVLAACGRLGFGAAGDAPHGDAAGDAGDASADAPGVTNCTGTLVCDTFDGTTLDPRWTIDTMVGEVTLDSTRAYRGTSSVHLHTDAITVMTTNPRALLDTSQGLPITGTIYTRAWMWFQSPMPGSPFAQILNYANTAGVGISMGERNSYVVDNDYTTPQYAQSLTQMLPLDGWTCLRMEMPSGTSGTTKIYVDKTEVADVELSQTSQPAPDHTYLGIEWVGSPTSQMAFDAWIDEVIISASPTTCDQ